MVRSARCSFSFGRTAQRPQPASEPSSTKATARLEKDRQPTTELLRIVRCVLVKEGPVPVVRAQGDALPQGDLEAGAGVEVRPDDGSGDEAQRPADAAEEHLLLGRRALADEALEGEVGIDEP